MIRDKISMTKINSKHAQSAITLVTFSGPVVHSP
jgi:hypothetical protein